MKIILSIVCLAIAIGETTAAHLKRSTGGLSLPIYRAPFFVSITVDGQYICGGAFITRRSVLTAAHCLVDQFYKLFPPMEVVSRKDNVNAAGTCHQIHRIRIHPEFEWQSRQNDIGVIILSERAEWSITRNFVALPTEELEHPKNATLISINTAEDSDGIFYLNELDLVTASIDFCPSLKPIDYIKLSNEFCGIAGNGKSIGVGDSGGAIVYRRKLVGIFSAWYYLDNRYMLVADVYRSLDFINSVKRF